VQLLLTWQIPPSFGEVKREMITDGAGDSTGEERRRGKGEKWAEKWFDGGPIFACDKISAMFRRIFISIVLLCGVATAQEHKITVTKFVPPLYPPIARAANISGTVELKVVANNQGHTLANAVGGHPILQKAALQMIEQWRFHCADCAQSQEFEVPVTVVFRLSDDLDSEYRYTYHFPQWVEVATGHFSTSDFDVKIGYKRSARCLWLWHCNR